MTTEHPVLSVSQLNHLSREALESALPTVRVEGEISNLAKPASGHIYFSLKDERAQVRCALFRGQLRNVKGNIENGIQVLVSARVSIYEGRGDYQLIVNSVEEAGAGLLQIKFEALKRSLAEEGLFDNDNKLELPGLPGRIGVITSASGAVLHDILTTLRRRFPAIDVLVLPVAVQGEKAAPQIVRALQLANSRGDCDVLILARGGGSLEDLWPFNEELVARAIYGSNIPIISAIGHETDITIADFVADVRAPTPTAAAEMLSPDQGEWLANLESIYLNLGRYIRRNIQDKQQQIDLLQHRLIHPQQRIIMANQRRTELTRRLHTTLLHQLHKTQSRGQIALSRLMQQTPLRRIRENQLKTEYGYRNLVQLVRQHYDRLSNRAQQLMDSLNTLSPLATLNRGYAIVTSSDTNKLVRDSTKMKTGDRVETTLARGRLSCVIEKVHKT